MIIYIVEFRLLGEIMAFPFQEIIIAGSETGAMRTFDLWNPGCLAERAYPYNPNELNGRYTRCFKNKADGLEDFKK